MACGDKRCCWDWESAGVMREIRYADEGMDMKKYVLCFIRKSWLVIVAAVLGAVIGGVVYAVAHIVPESEREYQAMSKVYLDFAADETGEIYQEYNGYTWNDLMATDPILDVTMENLSADYTREEVMAATKAEILSDLRLLTITVTTHDPDRCSDILQATGKSLVARGNAAKEFKQITVIQTTQVKPVTADSRLAQAVLVGLVAAILLMIVGMMLGYVLDDRILVASDVKQVTGVSFIGYAGAGMGLGRDYEENLAYLREKIGTVGILDVKQGVSVKKEADAQEYSAKQDGHITQDQSGEWGISREKWQELCAADGVVLVAEYGKVHAVYLAYVIEQLKVRECRLVGVAIGGADEKFLRRYYGRGIAK